MIKYCVDTIQFTMLIRNQCRLNVYSIIKKIRFIFVCFLKKWNKYLTTTCIKIWIRDVSNLDIFCEACFNGFLSWF